MHDPSTVAHEIKWPIRITIWHEDPLNFKGKHGTRRDDDSCGWFSPPWTEAEDERIKKLAKQQYSTIFEKQVRAREGASYAYLCNDPTTHEAIYWAWRSIKHLYRPKGPWQYGVRLSADEVQEIFELASNPVDNLRHTVANVKDQESFNAFFFCVYRAYLRHHRPWYRHPRWHLHHWRFQIHGWQTFRRWAFDRCAGCGKGFSWGYSPVGFQWHSPKPKFFCSAVDVYHSDCAGMTAALHKEPAQGSA